MKPALVAALRHQNMNSCGAGALARQLLGEQVFQRLPIFEVHRHIDIPRNVRLTDVELLEQGREEFAGMERVRGVTGVLARHGSDSAAELCSAGRVRARAPTWSVVASGRSSQKNSRRSSTRPPRMWNRFTASMPFSK